MPLLLGPWAVLAAGLGAVAATGTYKAQRSLRRRLGERKGDEANDNGEVNLDDLPMHQFGSANQPPAKPASSIFDSLPAVPAVSEEQLALVGGAALLVVGAVVFVRQQKGRALRAAQSKVFSKIAHVQRGIIDLRRRGKADVLAAQVAANRAFAEDLLAVADSLESALLDGSKGMLGAGDGRSEDTEALAATIEGIQGVHTALIKTFGDQGVTLMLVSPEDVFDPSLHAVLPGVQSTPEQTGSGKEGRVSTVVKAGYLFKGETLRHAQVTLALDTEAQA